MIPLKDTIPHRGFPLMTWSIILLNGIIFIYEISIPKDLLQQLFYLFGLVPAKYSYPKWAFIHGLPFDHYLSFLTNMFLHAGWLHIVGNMWFLHLFGSTVEDRMGHIRFLIFYLHRVCREYYLFYARHPFHHPWIRSLRCYCRSHGCLYRDVS